MTDLLFAFICGLKHRSIPAYYHKKLIPYYKPNGKNMYFDVEELIAWQKKNHFEPIGDRVESPRKDAS